jgi:NAD(P)-dependent dehydrogenase (short-subunit alcohol dehydrogenase family)/rhamnose utilization protein RhaD (predicted bifunctional aldolase and dehydrogenase)
MDQALADLIRISREVGADPSLVQGGGGNTSVKTTDGRYLYIKASGAALKDMSEGRGWRRLKLSGVLTLLDDPDVAALDPARRECAIVSHLQTCCYDQAAPEARPSVESHLHALLGRCIIHLHPVAVDAYVCAKQGRAQLEKLFAKEAPPPLWVPYTHPGYHLAQRVRALVQQYARQHGRMPAVLFLEKHGLFVSAESADEALAITHRVIATCTRGLPAVRKARPAQPAAEEATRWALAVRKAIFEAEGRYVAVRRFADGDIAAFLARDDAKALVSSPALTPDELVYTGGPPLWLERPDVKAIAGKLRRQAERDGKAPSTFLVPGLGLLATGAEKSIAIAREVVGASLAIRSAAASFGGVNPLTATQRRFIAEWEGESFRRQVAGLMEQGELAGRIAIITGAGSGLGRSIAAGLARAGASVAFADIDLPAAEEAVSTLAAGLPAFAVRCDVSDENQVDRAYAALLERWGGLDILVNAAGIAPPYALVDLPAAKWRQALEINLTGYFLMARAAARLMIRQGMGGSIINLSSKSGLEASRNNTPYNATKAGEIHLARGWALELGEHGIRVNAIAPGNVFEGSRIWNPEYIKACAKKYGITPEEVIPYYVNKTALRREITGQDIADAVVFLCSDRARTITGQVLVADSGQVMVR